MSFIEELELGILQLPILYSARSLTISLIYLSQVIDKHLYELIYYNYNRC